MSIKTAILGYGRSGSTLHAGPLEKLREDFDVAAICDIDPEAQSKARQRFGCPVYHDYREMLGREALDLVVIVTRSDQHAQMTCNCLDAGANVLVTKPWAVNMQEAQGMIAAAERSGKLLLPWLPARWGCDLARLREIIASGRIGKVFMIRRREFSFGVRCDWQTERRYGGGYLLNWGPHLIDQAVQLAGEKIKTVYGQMRQVINPGDSEDVFLALLTTASGIMLNCEFTVAADQLPNWVIQGDRGTVFVKETSMRLFRADFPDRVEASKYRTNPDLQETGEELAGDHRITMANRYGDPMVIYPAIARAVRGEAVYPVSTSGALELTRILDAVRTSSRENRIVTLE